MRNPVILIIICSVFWCDSPSIATEPSYAIQHSIDETRVRIPAPNQEIQSRDLLAALSDAADWDGQVLAEKLPEGDFDLSKRRTLASIRVIEKLLNDRAQFEIEKNQQGNAQALLIHINRQKLEADRREKQASIRHAASVVGPVIGLQTSDLQWGLRVIDPEKLTPGQRLVILIHGLQGSHDSLKGLLPPLRRQGFPCGTFAYANDGPIPDSVQLLDRELKALQVPEGVRITLVTHSMGGLVARGLVEDPARHDPRIDRLVMICPPNHGSNLAYLPPGLDLHEHLHDRPVSELPEFVFRSTVDGFNEAQHDLRPQSRFLLQLNSRPRNPLVRYSVLLGNSSPASSAQLDAVGEKLDDWCERSDTFRFFAPKLRKCLDHPEELTPGQGDGAVAIARGRLEEVNDTVELPIDHWTATDHLDTPIGQQLIREVLKRVQ
jgi:pimeloyl-ACP methyl ester carboxylesterase